MKRLIFAAMISAALLVPWTCAQQPATQKDPPPTIRQRQKRQQKRIGEGVASGQLTPAETKRLEQKEAELNQQIRRDRRDGGGLTKKERAKIQQKQDRLSKEIYKEKHDQQTAPPKK